MAVSDSWDRSNSGSRVEPTPVVAGQGLARLFLSLSGPFVQWDAVGSSLFAAVGVTGAGALPGPAAPVTSSAPLACTSGSVLISGGVTPVSAASVTGSSS